MKCIPLTDLAEIAMTQVNKQNFENSYPDIASHLNQCESCRKTFNEYLTIAKMLKHSLLNSTEEKCNQVGCPNDESFAAYFDKKMQGSERAAFETHLAHCEACFREFIDFSKIVESTHSARTGIVHFVIDLAAKKLQLLNLPSEFTYTHLEPAPVLGEESSSSPTLDNVCAWEQCINDIKIQFFAIRTEGNRINLSLQIHPASSIPTGARLNLWEDNKLVQSDLIPDTGSLELKGLCPCNYEGEIEFSENWSFVFRLTAVLNSTESDDEKPL